MNIILLLIGLIMSADGLYCGAVGTMGAGEATMVVIGIAFILWSSFYDAVKEKRILKVFRGILSVFMIVLVVYSCAICLIGSMRNETGSENYVIVLGSKLVDNTPTDTLVNRLDAAVEYLNRNTSAPVIVTGARSAGQQISEGQSMCNYLISRGINEGRILIEDSATNTYENFANTKDAVWDGKTVFVTSNYHVLRSALMAQLNGLDVSYIGAPTPVMQLPPACARELLATIASIRYYLPI